MFAVVNDVEAYRNYLPWCDEARILARRDNHMVASLSLSAGRVRHSLTTSNTLQPGRRIDMQMLEGPFRYLEGCWQFKPQGFQSCEVSLQLDFEYRNRLLKLALDQLLRKIANSLIGSFTRRADLLYGGQ